MHVPLATLLSTKYFGGNTAIIASEQTSQMIVLLKCLISVCFVRAFWIVVLLGGAHFMF